MLRLPVFPIGPAPPYTPAERMADGCIHALGLMLAAGAVPVLMLSGLGTADTIHSLGLILYGVGLVAMLSMSALYNMRTGSPRRDLLRRLDRAAIFLMIAGSYSPFTFGALAGGWGFALGLFEWSMAALGVVLVLVRPERTEGYAVTVYVMMGWAILLAFNPLVSAVGWTVTNLVLAGGMLYTIGLGFHAATRLKYHNAIWHAFVLLAAACHFVAIFLSLTPADAAGG